jgi:hypothetical protein
MSKFYFYNCFGLNIKSQISFPELRPGKNNFNAIIHFDREKKFPIEGLKKDTVTIKTSSNDISFIFDTKPLFRVRNGKEIIVNSDFKIEDMLLRSLLLGQGMGILLHQKGYLVLHGSAVKMGDNAIGFIGDCGEGKSTTTAALNSRGHPLITDDVLVIGFDKNNKPVLLPSFPRIKLWDDVIDLLTEGKEFFPKIHPKFQKYSYNIDENFVEDQLPLKTLYVIEKSEKNIITPLKSQQDALIELVRNAYMIFLLNKKEKNENLIQSARTVNNIDVKRLRRSNSLKDIEELLNILEDDVLNSKKLSTYPY